MFRVVETLLCPRILDTTVTGAQLVATALRTAVAPFLIRISNSSRQHVEAERMKVVAELVD
jgi:hypothetical protein